MPIIAHVDMDAFFAAVEERDDPRLRGLPIVVGAHPEGGKGRGVVATANYGARAYGIHSALPISTAWRLSEAAQKEGKPAVVFIRPSFDKYLETSRRIMKILEKYSSKIEQASVDEAYLDLSHIGTCKKAKKLAKEIKREIKVSESLTCTIGIGPNKMIAKIASGMQKPDGLAVVRPHEVLDFLSPLPARTIPGIGPKTEETLRRVGVLTIGELRRLSGEELEEHFGKWGREFYKKARGLDESPIVQEWEIKSIGEQETFRTDTLDRDFLLTRLKEISRRVFKRFSQSGFSYFRTVVLTVRFFDFDTKTRSKTVSEAMCTEEQIALRAIDLLTPFFDARENPKGKPIRLLGVRIERLKSDKGDATP
jgi:DNA polymerase IV (DinB-like DNA polymerase)